ncbi:MAG: hypothetical protein Roseis2KO_04160 [Roseivirga sp.]
MDEARGPEDRIEHIVREAEGGAQFKFNPAAWSAMEAKLDAAAPVPFAWWKILFPIAGTAILLTLLLWPIAARDTLENALAKDEVVKEQVLDKGQPSTSNEAKDNTTVSDNPAAEEQSFTPGPDTSTQASVADEGKDQPGRANASAPGKTNQNSAESVRPEANKAAAEEVNRTVSNTNDVRSDAYAFRASVQPNEVKETDQTSQKPQALGGNDDELIGQGVEMLTVRWQPDVLMFPQPVLIFELDSSVYADEAPETEYFQKSKWAFSAAVSADLSATGLEGFTDPGTMVGFAVEYYLADTWSVQTGATYAIKKYTALGNEYETPEWISARPDDLLSAIAKCTVIDIPLNVRKYFHTKKGKTFFASSGVSTYLMLREDYNYEYTEERPNWEPFWRYENRNNHFLGILNLSVGYETRISKNLALGIEPFMKLPLTGIGEGRVRFLSFGSNIAIKLRK